MGEYVVTRNRTIKLTGVEIDRVRKEIKAFPLPENIDILVEEDEHVIRLIISAKADSEDDAKALIKPIAKEFKKRFSQSVLGTKVAETLEGEVVKLLEKQELTITTAESCTGGLLAGRLINVPGVSDVYKEGFITYTNKSKRKTLDVSKSVLKKYGAVSKQTAKEMAFGAALVADADVALSITGIAGPDGGTKEKPVGLVYIGCFTQKQVVIQEYRFSGDRASIREQSVEAALELCKKCIAEVNK